MTTPTGSSPLRIGGIALVGVAVVAVVIGLVTLGTGGGGSSSSAAPDTTTASVAPPAPSAAAPGGNSVPVPSFTATVAPPAPTTVPPPVTQAPLPAAAGDGTGAGTGTGAGAGTGGEAAPALPLRVYNNSTIQGLAADAASDFRQAGWTVTDTTGYPYGTIPTSTVYYRAGTSEQASAQRLASEFGLKAEPRFPGIEDASSGLIVIVTRDYQRP